MDREGADVSRAMTQMQRILSPDCVYMQGEMEEVREEMAARDELLMEQHFEESARKADYLAGAKRAFAALGLYPVVSCSALTDQGVDRVLDAIAALCETDYESKRQETFRAKVYRVRRENGTRYCRSEEHTSELQSR